MSHDTPRRGQPCCHACGAPIALREPVAIYHERCDVATRDAGGNADRWLERTNAQHATLQALMQVLGPTAPTAPQCAGCASEIAEALAILADAGITYRPRK